MTESPIKARPTDRDSDEIDLVRLAAMFRHRWLQFLLVWVSASLMIVSALLTASPKFTSSGSLYLADSASGGGVADTLASILPGAGQDADIESQKEILKSALLAVSVIRRLGLNATIDGDSAIVPRTPTAWQWKLNPDPMIFEKGLRVEQSDVAAGVHTPQTVTLVFDDRESFTILNREVVIGRGSVNEMIETPQIRFVLRVYEGTQIAPGAEVELTIDPPGDLVERFSESLSVGGGGRPPGSNSMVEVAFTSKSPYLSRRVVQALLDEYLRLRHSWATEGASRTLEFVTSQIETLQKEMDLAGQRLARFQQENRLIDLGPQIESQLEQLVSYEAELSKQQLQLDEIRKMTASLRGGDHQTYLMVFVEDDSIQEFVRRLSNINLQIASLEASYTDDYRPLRDLRVARESVVSDLRKSLENASDRLEFNVKGLQAKVDEAREQMTLLPDQARALTEYERRARVFNELFVFLFQQQQQARIAVESTLTPIRPIDQPSLVLKSSSPQLRLVGMVAMTLGGLISAIGVVVPTLLVRWYASVDDVKREIDLPVFAIVPHRDQEAKRGTAAIVESKSNSAFSESMRMLRTNIVHSMAGRKHQRVLVTSCMPGDGKTSICSNLAITMARSARGLAVVLIDADMHHPSLHGVFGIRQSPGLSDYLNGDVELEEIICTVDVSAGRSLSLVPAGPIPPTPADLIETPRMKNLFSYCEQHYTISLIDSPPFPLVSTASILAPDVTRVLSVCRVGQTNRRLYGRHIEELYQVSGSMGLIINVTARSHAAYGSYGYGYGNAYGYGDPQDRGDEDSSSGNGSVSGRSSQGAREVPGGSAGKPSLSVES